MPRSRQKLEYELHAQSPRISIPSALILAVLSLAVLYSLWFQLGPDEVPLKHVNHPPQGVITREQFLRLLATDLGNASKGTNLELRIDASDAEKNANKDFFTVQYYSAVYDLYPARVFIGSDDHIVNNGDGLYAADQLPSIDWMRRHQVSTVFTLLPPVQPGRETMNAK